MIRKNGWPYFFRKWPFWGKWVKGLKLLNYLLAVLEKASRPQAVDIASSIRFQSNHVIIGATFWCFKTVSAKLGKKRQTGAPATANFNLTVLFSETKQILRARLGKPRSRSSSLSAARSGSIRSQLRWLCCRWWWEHIFLDRVANFQKNSKQNELANFSFLKKFSWAQPELAKLRKFVALFEEFTRTDWGGNTQ